MFSGICVPGQASAEAEARAPAKKKDTKGFLVVDCQPRVVDSKFNVETIAGNARKYLPDES